MGTEMFTSFQHTTPREKSTYLSAFLHSVIQIHTRARAHTHTRTQIYTDIHKISHLRRTTWQKWGSRFPRVPSVYPRTPRPASINELTTNSAYMSVCVCVCVHNSLPSSSSVYPRTPRPVRINESTAMYVRMRACMRICTRKYVTSLCNKWWTDNHVCARAHANTTAHAYITCINSGAASAFFVYI